MFWAITCEPGKRYSQVPAESFRVSMAALEPKDNIPSNKQVSLMLENKGKEFLLCTLEYDRVMQVNLDLRFGCGEEYVFFISGEGIIHLSGHIMESLNVTSEKQLYNNLIENMSFGQTEPCHASDDDEEESLIEEVDEEVAGTHRLLALDSEEEEDDDCDEWKPGVSDFDDIFAPSYAFGARPETRSKSGKKKVNFAESCDNVVDDSYVLPQVDIVDELDDAEGMNEDSEDDEDEDDNYEPNENDGADDDKAEDISEEEEDEDVPNHTVEALVGSKKRKKSSILNDHVKRTKSEVKNSRPLVIEYVGITSESKKAKKKLKKKQRAMSAEGSSNEDVRETAGDDIMNSSIGRTPMPKKKSGILKANMNSSSCTSPVSSNEKRSAQKPMRFKNRLPSGIEFEDLKVGSGPPARPGKLVHMFYVGSLTSGKIFDKINPPAKPLTFRLGRNEIIKGLDVGLEGMRVGGKRCIKIPPHMGYGKKDRENIPANSVLLFTVDLRAVS